MHEGAGALVRTLVLALVLVLALSGGFLE